MLFLLPHSLEIRTKIDYYLFEANTTLSASVPYYFFDNLTTYFIRKLQGCNTHLYLRNAKLDLSLYSPLHLARWHLKSTAISQHNTHISSLKAPLLTLRQAFTRKYNWIGDKICKANARLLCVQVVVAYNERLHAVLRRLGNVVRSEVKLARKGHLNGTLTTYNTPSHHGSVIISGYVLMSGQFNHIGLELYLYRC